MVLATIHYIGELFTDNGDNHMTKLSKKVWAILLATMMLLGTTSQAMAASPNESTVVENSGETEVMSFTLDATPRENQTIGGSIPSNQSRTWNTNLDSYVGLNKNFCAVSSSSSTTGALYVYLYKDGQLKSKDWVMGVNENRTVTWSMFLPASGTWQVKVVASGTNAPVTFYGWWQN